MNRRNGRRDATLNRLFMSLKETDRLLHSNSEFRQLLSSMYGLKAFVAVLESSSGLASAARLQFVQYCYGIVRKNAPASGATVSLKASTPSSSSVHSKDSKGRDPNNTYGPTAQFMLLCCRIRLSEDGEVFPIAVIVTCILIFNAYVVFLPINIKVKRYLMQNLVQKYLTLHENVLVAADPDLEDVITDLKSIISHNLEKNGRPPTIDQFDEIFEICAMNLRKIFFNFIRSRASRYILIDFLNAEAENHYASAIVIQTFWRQKYVSWQVARKRQILMTIRSMNALNNAAKESGIIGES